MFTVAQQVVSRRFPGANGAYKDGRFELYSRVMQEIAGDARSLAGKVRDGRVTPPLSGATFTEAIVNPPQAGILAVGEIADRPVVKDGQVVPGKLMEITLSCDHRILYGADGAEFLAEVKRILQEPLALSL